MEDTTVFNVYIMETQTHRVKTNRIKGDMSNSITMTRHVKNLSTEYKMGQKR